MATFCLPVFPWSLFQDSEGLVSSATIKISEQEQIKLRSKFWSRFQRKFRGGPGASSGAGSEYDTPKKEPNSCACSAH